MQILSWDIEAANLSANFGVVLCVGFKVVGSGKPWVLSLGDFGWPDDNDIFRVEKRLLKAVKGVLENADVWLTHYGGDGRFDLPYLNTRLLYHNIAPLDRAFPQIDTWKISRYGLKLSSNRLNTIQEFFGLKDEKNKILPGLWIKALTGHKPSMRYIVEHCRRDVLVLEEAYLKLRALDKSHPWHGEGGCRNCGSMQFQYRGYHRTATRVYRRFQCKTCGKWDHERKPVKRYR